VFAARGAGPFQLAYGSRDAKPTAFPIATLVPGYKSEEELGTGCDPPGGHDSAARVRLRGRVELQSTQSDNELDAFSSPEELRGQRIAQRMVRRIGNGSSHPLALGHG